MTVRHVVLVGLPGSGKTSVAAAVGARLSCEVVELDAEIERLAGASVAEIFGRFGEAAFRRYELEVTGQLLKRERSALVSAGGGWIVNARARALVPASWSIVYLRVSPREAARRLAGDRHERPLLAGAGTVAGLSDRLEQLATERGPLYERAATTIDTDAVPLPHVVDRTADVVAEWLQKGS